VEMRILRRLFTPEEAELALHLTLLNEEPRVVARRAKKPVEEVAQRLEEMAQKGLAFSSHRPGRAPRYAIQQFAIGFYEGQVNRLTPELVRDVEEYLPQYIAPEQWGKAPQLRTIPVGASVDTQSAVMPYESAESLVCSHNSITITNCICRQEKRLLGEGCDKPLESCMTLGSAARYFVQIGRGRAIGQDEAMEILKRADEAGLVLQPSNSQDIMVICMCCGCCCGVLQSVKRHPKPASVMASPFVAALDAALCEACGVCETRCQMDAVRLDGDTAVLNLDRCIGCGLCVTTCPSGALTLVRKPDSEQPPVPKNITATYIQVGRARGKMGLGDLAGLMVKSQVDRLLSRE
jgi:electron transport complex protein RnfB